MASKNREKDQAMAARLKADGDKRTSFRCPICTKVVAIEQGYAHLAYHPA
jgi:hypothetical protein